MNGAKRIIEKNFEQLVEVVSKKEAVLKEVELAAKNISSALENKNKIMFCGNGGSASDSNHWAAELVNKYQKDRPPLAGISLVSNSSNLTAIANDYSFEYVFSKQVEAIGKEGDVLVAISTSGESKNILNAISIAKNKGIFTILFTGDKKTTASENSDLVIAVPSSETPRIQELHLLIFHSICEILESELF